MKYLMLCLLAIAMSGCGSMAKTMKSWVSSDESDVAPAVVADETTRFSDNPNVGNVSSRQYRRMTKDRMEQEADLQSSAGSMWQMEGQGSYLFTQNTARREGDLLNVKVDGTAQQQVSTKVDVIKKLLKRLEDAESAAEISRGLASVDAQKANPTGQQPDPANATGAAPAAAPAVVAAKPEAKEEPFNVSMVPTRIVEKLPDGNFRVRGSQPFMIGKREYKVIVTGLIRPEDFSDEGISSNKLLDPQFDVVSLRRKESL